MYLSSEEMQILKQLFRTNIIEFITNKILILEYMKLTERTQI